MRHNFNKMILILVAAIFMLTGCLPNAKKTETIDWINNTYIVFTTVNQLDSNLVGGLEKNAASEKAAKKMLVDYWDVNNREQAEQMIESLIAGMHNVEFNSVVVGLCVDQMSEEHYHNLRDELEKPDDKRYLDVLYCAYNTFGSNAIKAWDLCRATQLLGNYYVAGYYTYGEALDKSLEIAQMMQATYQSWDELFESYLYGYEYWSKENILDTKSEAYQRSMIIAGLKNEQSGPYNLPWDTELIKTW